MIESTNRLIHKILNKKQMIVSDNISGISNSRNKEYSKSKADNQIIAIKDIKNREKEQDVSRNRTKQNVFINDGFFIKNALESKEFNKSIDILKNNSKMYSFNTSNNNMNLSNEQNRTKRHNSQQNKQK